MSVETPNAAAVGRIIARLNDTQREIILRGEGEINCDDGYVLIGLGVFAHENPDPPDDEYQGFAFTPLGLAVRQALQENPHG